MKSSSNKTPLSKATQDNISKANENFTNAKIPSSNSSFKFLTAFDHYHNALSSLEKNSEHSDEFIECKVKHFASKVNLGACTKLSHPDEFATIEKLFKEYKDKYSQANVEKYNELRLILNGTKNEFLNPLKPFNFLLLIDRLLDDLDDLKKKQKKQERINECQTKISIIRNKMFSPAKSEIELFEYALSIANQVKAACIKNNKMNDFYRHKSSLAEQLADRIMDEADKTSDSNAIISFLNKAVAHYTSAIDAICHDNPFDAEDKEKFEDIYLIALSQLKALERLISLDKPQAATYKKTAEYIINTYRLNDTQYLKNADIPEHSNEENPESIETIQNQIHLLEVGTGKRPANRSSDSPAAKRQKTAEKPVEKANGNKPEATAPKAVSTTTIINKVIAAPVPVKTPAPVVAEKSVPTSTTSNATQTTSKPSTPVPAKTPAPVATEKSVPTSRPSNTTQTTSKPSTPAVAEKPASPQLTVIDINNQPKPFTFDRLIKSLMGFNMIHAKTSSDTEDKHLSLYILEQAKSIIYTFPKENFPHWQEQLIYIEDKTSSIYDNLEEKCKKEHSRFDKHLKKHKENKSPNPETILNEIVAYYFDEIKSRLSNDSIYKNVKSMLNEVENKDKCTVLKNALEKGLSECVKNKTGMRI